MDFNGLGTLEIYLDISQNVNIALYQRFKRISHFGGGCVFLY